MQIGLVVTTITKYNAFYSSYRRIHCACASFLNWVIVLEPNACAFFSFFFFFFIFSRFSGYFDTVHTCIFPFYLRIECINELNGQLREVDSYFDHINFILMIFFRSNKKKTELLKPCNRLCVPTQNTQKHTLSLARAQLHYFSATAIKHFSTAQHWSRQTEREGDTFTIHESCN